MDIFGHQVNYNRKVMEVHQSNRNKRNKTRGVKVVYISTPMKVKTSASKFRALVQELTGRDSDVARLMEINGAPAGYGEISDVHKTVNCDQGLRFNLIEDPSRYSPTGSDTFPDSFDDIFVTQQKEEDLKDMFETMSFLLESPLEYEF